MPNILHIGYHKTASTWFQKRLYPHLTSHAAVPRRVVQEAVLMDDAFAFDPATALDRLQAGLEDAGRGRRLLLCEEELSGNPHSAGMRGAQSKDIAERLARTLPDAHVVVVIRNQVDMAAALYAHYVREGGTHGPRRYLCPERYRRDVARHPFKYPLFAFSHLDYGGLVDCYARLFGEERVHLFPFERFRADPRGFVAGYARRLGLTLDRDLDDLDWRPDNAGFGRNALGLARLLNRFTYRSVLDKHYIVRGLSNKVRSNLPRALAASRFAGPRQTPRELLGDDLIATIHQRFAAPNRALAERWGLPLAELGYPFVHRARGDGLREPFPGHTAGSHSRARSGR